MSAVGIAVRLFDAGRGVSWSRATCVAQWPDEIPVLEAGRLLQTIGLANSAQCDACGDLHDIEDCEELAFLCPMAGRVRIRRSELVLLAFDQVHWLAAVGAALDMPPPEPVIADALWRFRQPQRGGWRKQIWIARGLGEAAAFDNAARAIKADGRRARCLLTSSELPRECEPALHAQVVRFADCAEISATGALLIDLERVAGVRKGRKGSPGRRAKVGPAIDLFSKRVSEGAAASILAEEARQIEAVLARQLAPDVLPSVRTIEDVIRDEHAKAFGRARPVKC